MHAEYTTNTPHGQEVLKDVTAAGKVRPWRQHHTEGLLLSEIYNAMAEAVGGTAEPETEAITLEGVTTYQLDSTGAPVLDANGQPVPEGPAKFHTPRVRVEVSAMC